MSSSGAYLDSGVIGNAANTLAAYGRLVVPLGQRPKRLDCDRLYQLELQRLELEVRLMQQGLDPRLQLGDSDALTDEATWTMEGRR
ncbi:hypothetical protein AB2N04_10240 [Nitratireductor sp. GISD-1A_MAKvit]|uniref:hypothetical protein n=1 Tax=Nitratireductor sp. GISD-1A_MAKvit TaxID=3234198 RepID=UPI003467D457